jgi:glycosyltransferase involved in cell wall biosynthesis
MRSLTDGYIFMNRSSEAEYLRRYPEEGRKTIWRVPHSAYPVAKISSDRREELRQTLTRGTNCMLVGFLGEIRPYKNPTLLEFLPKIDARGRPLRIIAAGRYHASCNFDTMDALFRNFDSERLVRIDERLSDEKLAEFIQATDLVLLPYLRGWNSGFAMFVLGAGGRILCSNLPMFRELADELGPPWVYLFDHAAGDLSKELNDAISPASLASPDAADHNRLQRFLKANSFEDAALRHADLYRDLMGSKRVPQC